jgi:hypothetical protein
MTIKGYTGYELTEVGRATLLAHFPAVHPDVITHHVTHEFGVDDSIPPHADFVTVIAQAQNDLVQAVVVAINANVFREDGKIYHITVSVNKELGGKPVQSNDLLTDPTLWHIVSPPLTVAVTPKFFPFKG